MFERIRLLLNDTCDVATSGCHRLYTFLQTFFNRYRQNMIFPLYCARYSEALQNIWDLRGGAMESKTCCTLWRWPEFLKKR